MDKEAHWDDNELEATRYHNLYLRYKDRIDLALAEMWNSKRATHYTEVPTALVITQCEGQPGVFFSGSERVSKEGLAKRRYTLSWTTLRICVTYHDAGFDTSIWKQVRRVLQ